MADSLLSPRALLLAVLLAPAVAIAASPRSLNRGAAAERELTIDAAAADVDINTNHLKLPDVTISQGGTSVKAREAEAEGPDLSFDNSRWEFRGDVRIRFEGGTLDADNAKLTFAGNRIARAEARGAPGSPAKFAQKLPNPSEEARGEAGNIDFDVAAGRVTLTQGISFNYGRSEYRSETLPLVYSLRDRRVVSGGNAAAAPAPNAGGNGGAGRIHITIHPNDDADAPPEPPAP